jgi:NADH-quinone oxidoreductase subunit J
MVELFVFAVAGAVCLAGAIGVVTNPNPVHAALSLVATLFGVAVLFVAQQANFLAAVQVIVYAGAIVVLFLFVLMLLGVDQAEDLTVEPLAGQRVAAAVLGLAVFALPVLAILSVDGDATGIPAAAGAANSLSEGATDVALIGRSLFTRYLLAFEITAVLLVIAVVGAVMMAKRPPAGSEVDDPLVAAAEQEAADRAAAEQQEIAEEMLDEAADDEAARP